MKRHSPTYCITIRLRYADDPGQLGRVTSMIGDAGGSVSAVDIVNISGHTITRDITVSASDEEHGDSIVARMRSVDDVEVLKVSDRTFLMHLGGKIEIASKVPIKTRDDLSLAYTPGVARVCRVIHADPDAAFALTIRRNIVAVVTDGSAVLGMGNIGPRAALPVMEGKALLFKEFGGVDAFPICLDTQDTEKIVETCVHLAPTFGGINLEDISAPRCVEIEERLQSLVDIPVFHDDQHGTAIVVLAALINSLKVVRKSIDQIRVTINGAGAAGLAAAKLLMSAGVRQIVMCDRRGAIYRGRSENMNVVKQWLAEHTNHELLTGSLSDVIASSDVFIGVSVAGALTVDGLKRMADDPIVIALASPDPEIDLEEARPYVKVIATSCPDYPNQVSSVLCFPGFFRGMLQVRARRVNGEMKVAAAHAIAQVLTDDECRPDYVIPSVFDRRVSQSVAAAVSSAAIDSGVARRER